MIKCTTSHKISKVCLRVDLKNWMTFGWIRTYVGPAKDSNLKILFLVLRLLIKWKEWQWMTSLWLALWGINDVLMSPIFLQLQSAGACALSIDARALCSRGYYVLWPRRMELPGPRRKITNTNTFGVKKNCLTEAWIWNDPAKVWQDQQNQMLK